MNHYTYLITFNNSMQYVGVHSTHLKPELDACYLGSGTGLPVDRTLHNCTKEILNTYATRQEAVAAETQYIIKNDCVTSLAYYNKRLGNFDKHGQTKELNSNVEITTSKISGRTGADHQYLADKGKAFSSKYGGKQNRTPAMLAADEQRSKKALGTTNPAKGHKSVTNQAFKPWYFIPLGGDMVVIRDTTKIDYAHNFGMSKTQLKNKFYVGKANLPIKQGKHKGWIFGNLEDIETGNS